MQDNCSLKASLEYIPSELQYERQIKFKIYSKKKHKNRNDYLYICIIAGNTVRFYCKASCAGSSKTVTDRIKYRHAAHCYLADPEYGKRLAKALGINLNRVKELASLDETERLRQTCTE